MEALFSTLVHAVTGSPSTALAAAAAWGVLSILLSPCHLASIPLIVGFINGQGVITTRRALILSSLFAIGILITIAVIGALTAAAGRMLGDLGSWANWLVAVIFFGVGAHLLGIIPQFWSGAGQVKMHSKGLLAAFLLGLIFGVALGPCTFAFMAPVLGVVFHEAPQNPAYAILLLTAYGVGHCAVIVCAGTCVEAVQRYLHWNEAAKGTLWLRRICGLLVIAGGVWLLYSGA